MIEVMAPADDNFTEIIRLQLRKPKTWNWELSTSKSSPHIALPTIQLLNARGKLLVQAKHDGTLQRQTWHSSQILPIQRKNREQEIHLQRCKSDNLERRIQNHLKTNNSQNVIIQKPLSTQLSVDDHLTTLQRCQSVSLINNSTTNSKNRYESINRQKNPYVRVKPISDKIHEFSKEKLLGNRETSNRKLRKSRSDFLAVPGRDFPLQHNYSADIPQKTKLYRKHKRSHSDHLLRHTQKFNSEESLKRAELDGYRNFITPNVTRNNFSNTSASKNNANNEENKEVKKKPQLQPFNAETIEIGNNKPQNIQVSEFNHKIYYIRESRAGALVVCESFNKNHRRRGSTTTSTSTSIPSQNSLERIFEPTDTVKHIRQISDSLLCSTRRSLENNTDQRKNRSTTSLDLELVYSKKASTDSTKKTFQPKIDQNSNYIVQEPLATHLTDKKDSIIEDIFQSVSRRVSKDSYDTDRPCLIQQLSTTSEERKDSLAVIEDLLGTVEEKLEKLKNEEIDKRRKKKRSSSASNMRKSPILGNECNEVAAYPRPAYVGDRGVLGSACRPMGANVSRHSAKGLSGRRSRSSGSICNGRGRCNSNAASEGGEAKVCSSLPSYLDDGGCDNNNHQVERIPPLGGADGCSAPLHWKFSDGGQSAADQGYGSERSPEEEYPPPVPAPDENGLNHDGRDRHLEPHACYPFITHESTFVVRINKGPRGLGLSVCGGTDGGGSWPGLVRVKRLFPGQPAASCGRLRVGDVLLHANGIPLTGLTSYEALEVLRTAPASVTLRVCRPPPDVLNCVSPVSEAPPPPPRREPPNSLNLNQDNCFGTPQDNYYHGEFDITLTKIQGSLGFTLRKEDDSALGHYVRALVREPALTDGRIKAGDKIIAVNDMEISSMSHEAAVQFLRGAGERVRLRLFRDAAQTPVATLSPTDVTPRSSFSKKVHLRQEAVDMLNDIAVKKFSNVGGHAPVGYRRSLSPNSSPRRSHVRHQSEDPAAKYVLPEEHFHEALLHRCHHPFDDEAFNSLFSVDSEDDRPSRPSSLDLYNPNQTPVATRKPRFNFSLAHNAYELNNLDAEVLDAPNLTYNLEEAKEAEIESADSFPQEPASMPHIPLERSMNFSYTNPVYQSAHPVIDSDEKVCKKGVKSEENNMKKWKGVVIQPQEETCIHEQKQQEKHDVPLKDEYDDLAIELNRGWNSRLGFSLQGAAGVTYVSAVHADSVAARDGRIKPGDVVIKVNDESVEHMSTNEIIDLLRILRGPVCIVVKRHKNTEDCPNRSNAEN